MIFWVLGGILPLIGQRLKPRGFDYKATYHVMQPCVITAYIKYTITNVLWVCRSQYTWGNWCIFSKCFFSGGSCLIVYFCLRMPPIISRKRPNKGKVYYSLFLLVNSKILLSEVFLFFLHREQEMRNSILAQVLDQSARARCK